MTSINKWADKYRALRLQVKAQLEMLETMGDALEIAVSRMREIQSDIDKTVEVIEDALRG